MTTIVIPTRGDDGNGPLRWALRAIDANVPGADVWVVGWVPAWLSAEARAIRVPQTCDDKWRNAKLNLAHACRHPQMPPEWLLWNDDFFPLQPAAGFPAVHLGSLSGQLSRYRAAWPASRYTKALGATLAELQRRGLPESVSYEAHLPLPVATGALSPLLDECLQRPEVLLARSLYGNTAAIGGSRGADVKVYGRRSPLPAGAWASTSPAAWGGRAGAALREMFAEPSRFEEGGGGEGRSADGPAVVGGGGGPRS